MVSVERRRQQAIIVRDEPDQGRAVGPHRCDGERLALVMPDTQQVTTTRAPASIIALHALAGIGVLFWLSRALLAVTSADPDVLWVIALAVVLGGAHVAVSMLTARHSRLAILAMWFIAIGDGLLAIFVNEQAIVLVAFTVIMLLLAHSRAARAWYAAA